MLVRIIEGTLEELLEYERLLRMLAKKPEEATSKELVPSK
jgi:hypothetical protein